MTDVAHYSTTLAVPLSQAYALFTESDWLPSIRAEAAKYLKHSADATDANQPEESLLQRGIELATGVAAHIAERVLLHLLGPSGAIETDVCALIAFAEEHGKEQILYKDCSDGGVFDIAIAYARLKRLLASAVIAPALREGKLITTSSDTQDGRESDSDDAASEEYLNESEKPGAVVVDFALFWWLAESCVELTTTNGGTTAAAPQHDTVFYRLAMFRNEVLKNLSEADTLDQVIATLVARESGDEYRTLPLPPWVLTDAVAAVDKFCVPLINSEQPAWAEFCELFTPADNSSGISLVRLGTIMHSFISFRANPFVRIAPGSSKVELSHVTHDSSPLDTPTTTLMPAEKNNQSKLAVSAVPPTRKRGSVIVSAMGGSKQMQNEVEAALVAENLEFLSYTELCDTIEKAMIALTSILKSHSAFSPVDLKALMVPIARSVDCCSYLRSHQVVSNRRKSDHGTIEKLHHMERQIDRLNTARQHAEERVEHVLSEAQTTERRCADLQSHLQVERAAVDRLEQEANAWRERADAAEVGRRALEASVKQLEEELRAATRQGTMGAARVGGDDVASVSEVHNQLRREFERHRAEWAAREAILKEKCRTFTEEIQTQTERITSLEAENADLRKRDFVVADHAAAANGEGYGDIDDWSTQASLSFEEEKVFVTNRLRAKAREALANMETLPRVRADRKLAAGVALLQQERFRGGVTGTVNLTADDVMSLLQLRDVATRWNFVHLLLYYAPDLLKALVAIGERETAADAPHRIRDAVVESLTRVIFPAGVSCLHLAALAASPEVLGFVAATTSFSSLTDARGNTVLHYLAFRKEPLSADILRSALTQLLPVMPIDLQLPFLASLPNNFECKAEDLLVALDAAGLQLSHFTRKETRRMHLLEAAEIFERSKPSAQPISSQKNYKIAAWVEGKELTPGCLDPVTAYLSTASSPKVDGKSDIPKFASVKELRQHLMSMKPHTNHDHVNVAVEEPAPRSLLLGHDFTFLDIKQDELPVFSQRIINYSVRGVARMHIPPTDSHENSDRCAGLMRNIIVLTQKRLLLLAHDSLRTHNVFSEQYSSRVDPSAALQVLLEVSLDAVQDLVLFSSHSVVLCILAISGVDDLLLDIPDLYVFASMFRHYRGRLQLSKVAAAGDPGGVASNKDVVSLQFERVVGLCTARGERRAAMAFLAPEHFMLMSLKPLLIPSSQPSSPKSHRSSPAPSRLLSLSLPYITFGFGQVCMNPTLAMVNPVSRSSTKLQHYMHPAAAQAVDVIWKEFILVLRPNGVLEVLAHPCDRKILFTVDVCVAQQLRCFNLAAAAKTDSVSTAPRSWNACKPCLAIDFGFNSRPPSLIFSFHLDFERVHWLESLLFVRAAAKSRQPASVES